MSPLFPFGVWDSSYPGMPRADWELLMEELGENNHNEISSARPVAPKLVRCAFHAYNKDTAEGNTKAASFNERSLFVTNQNSTGMLYYHRKRRGVIDGLR